MADFTTLKFQANTGTSDASPTFTDVLLSTALYELRMCASGAGAGNIASAAWPIYTRPASTGVVPECWVYLESDNSGGLKVTTYDGTTAHFKQFLVSWDALGTFAGAPIISAWKDNTYPAASPGTQPTPGDGSAIVNGQSSDTSSTSYLKANAYGFGVDTGGTQQTPSANAGGTLAVTSGTAGAVSPATGAWLATWQSLQAATNYIQDGVTPKATTAGLWYFLISLFTGPNMQGGVLLPQLGFQYLWV